MAKPKHNFLTKQFGSVSGRDGSMVLTANPKTVEWADGKVIHPDQIEKVYCYGKGLKPVRKNKINLENGETAYTLWFTSPYGKTIRYSAVVDSDGNPTERGHL